MEKKLTSKRESANMSISLYGSSDCKQDCGCYCMSPGMGRDLVNANAYNITVSHYDVWDNL